MGTPAVNAPSIKHKEIHSLVPEDIIIEESMNGRMSPHTDQDVYDRAISLLSNGQIAPVGIRKDEANDGRPKLAFGFLRAKAALFINKEWLPIGGPKDAEGNPIMGMDGKPLLVNEPFRLLAMIVRGSDRDAYLRNIQENLERVPTSVMDQVINQERLSTVFHLGDEEIAKVYKSTVQHVQRNRRLLALPKDIQMLIHKGYLSAEGGFKLLALTDAEKKEVVDDLIKQAEERGVRVDTSEQGNFVEHAPAEDVQHPDYGKPYEAKGTGTGAAAAKLREIAGDKKGSKRIASAAKVDKVVRQKLEAKGKTGDVRKANQVLEAIFNMDATGYPANARKLARKIKRYKDGLMGEKALENAILELLQESEVDGLVEEEPTRAKARKGGKAAGKKAA